MQVLMKCLHSIYIKQPVLIDPLTYSLNGLTQVPVSRELLAVRLIQTIWYHSSQNLNSTNHFQTHYPELNAVNWDL